jgi:hypothetical protein
LTEAAPESQTPKASANLPAIDQPTSIIAQNDGQRRSLKPDKNRASQAQSREIRDPFSDLKAAFEPPKEKLKTFNRDQIVTKHGVVLMNMLERLLEYTEIDAHDVNSEQTLLEYACEKGNVGLAKLCYRRGANLSAVTKQGKTPFTIVTKNKRYDIMEFLHLYGVKINSCDAEGNTALHIAAGANDVDAVCRLVEWGADVNICNKKKQTPLHHAAAGGHYDVTMLLLDFGADLNAKDSKEYTPMAWAEAKDKFDLFNRLEKLGGKGHGLSDGALTVGTRSPKELGDHWKKVMKENVSSGMQKSGPLGRIGKVAVKDMPAPLQKTLIK